MKKSIIALAAFAVAGLAYANGNGTPTGQQEQEQGQEQGQEQTQNVDIGISNGGATANATGVGFGGQGGRGGEGGQGGKATALGGSLNNNSRYFSFAAPSWTVVPQAYGCLVTDSASKNIALGVWSDSYSKQYSEVVCTTIRMSESARSFCQYETAAMLDKQAFELMYPKMDGSFFLKDMPRNLSHEECEATKRPVMVLDTRMSTPAPRHEAMVESDGTRMISSGTTAPAVQQVIIEASDQCAPAPARKVTKRRATARGDICKQGK